MYYFQTKKKFAFVLCSMLSSLGPSHWSMLGFQKILAIFLVSPSYLLAISVSYEKAFLQSAILLFPVILYQMLEYSRESDRLVLYGDTVHDQQGRTVQGEEHGDAAGLGAVAVGGQRR